MRSDEDYLLAGALGAVSSFAHGSRQLQAVQRASFLVKKNVLEVDFSLSMPPRAAADRVRQVLGELGRVLDLEGASASDDPQVVGLLRAGFFNMNPAVVTVTIEGIETGSKLVVRGAAREGLIKQHAGEEAAKRVMQALA
jgi:hypothetical protein